MKIWMSNNNREGKVILSALGGILILMLFNVISLIPTIILFHDSVIMLLLWVIIITTIDVAVAVRIGASRRRDSLLFLRDNKGALFVVDITKFVRYRRGLLGLYSMERDREKILNNLISERKFETILAQENSLHGFEIEIEGIETIKRRRDGINLVCRVIYPNRNKGRVSYFVKNGYEDQEMLIYDLESRLFPTGDVRVLHKNHTVPLILSSCLLFVDIVLCVMSHPVLGIIDVAFYFYFLGASVLIFSYFLYIVIIIRRGL